MRFPSGLAAQLSLSFAGGALAVPAFAPLYWWPLALVSLLILFVAWQHAASAWRIFACGFFWGLGVFTTGVSWIYVSLHVYGSMPAILAGLATFLFCCYLSLYPALAGILYRWFSRRFTPQPLIGLLVLMPACFVIFEYLRGWVVSGFPWLTIGYSQTPGGFIGAPLAGYAPLLGMFGITWLLALSVSLGMLLLRSSPGIFVSRRGRIATGIALFAMWGAGALLQAYPWSENAGPPLKVALLQGNVEQNLKWRDDQRLPTLANYFEQVKSTQAKLIVMPETALPDFLERIPSDYLDALKQHAIGTGGDIVMGAPVIDRAADRNTPPHLANSAISIGTSATQRYDKRHLVAFGEFVPPMLSWVYRWLKIPLSDFSPPEGAPLPMNIAGHTVAINICYEDAFGAEIAWQLPDAALLVNISNMAWFGDSLAPWQHAQMSQMRAMETGRWMLRATNTGATAAINEKGVVLKSLPGFTRGVLEVDAQPLKGATPYSRWRDTPVLLILIACLLLSYLLREKSARKI
ncbi:MAG: apolipoprotein N-acyltransferase [Betaproteobacteria bacterium]